MEMEIEHACVVQGVPWDLDLLQPKVGERYFWLYKYGGKTLVKPPTFILNILMW